jgi:putative phage-type endonuclease|tara:strand:- start:2055 stop:2969 length:915 start_codon:yes stop_codon:yes gene_type:complete
MNTQSPTIGSSSISSILGLSPWSSPWDVWARMHGLTESSSTAATARGHILEPAIGAHYAHLNNVKISKGPEYEAAPIIGPEPWMHARPDFFVSIEDAKWLLEIKSTRKFDQKWGRSGTSNVPPHYAAQCIWQMAVTNDDRCDLAAFATISDEYRSYKIYRDDRIEEKIISFARDWYKKHIEKGIPPEVDGSSACSKSLAKLFRQENKDFIEPQESHIALADELKQIRAQYAELEKRKKHLENQIKECIGTSYGIAGIATWSESKPRRTFDRSNFEQQHPELAKQYIVEGDPTRTFRFQYTGESK